MASLVFSTKRNYIEFEYIFNDNTSVVFTYYTKTQNDYEADIAFGATNPLATEILAYSKKSFLSRIDGSANSKEKLLAELCENTSIAEFEAQLDKALLEAKKQK
jgi:hypothetical protein